LALPAGKREDNLASNVSKEFSEDRIDKTEAAWVEHAAVHIRDLVVCGVRRIGHEGLHTAGTARSLAAVRANAA